LHRFGAEALADYTAGGESHPALKIAVFVFISISRWKFLVKSGVLW
jgi:hypothetical protein